MQRYASAEVKCRRMPYSRTRSGKKTDADMDSRTHQLVFFMMAALSVLAAPAVAADGADLVTPHHGPLAGLEAPDPLTLRSRLVTLDLTQLQRVHAKINAGRTPQTTDTTPPGVPSDPLSKTGRTLILNLFDDVAVTALVERTAPTFSGGYSVSGRLLGKPYGTMTLVVNDERVVGRVQSLEGTYRIATAGKGIYSISEVREPPMNCAAEAPQAVGEHSR